MDEQPKADWLDYRDCITCGTRTMIANKPEGIIIDTVVVMRGDKGVCNDCIYALYKLYLDQRIPFDQRIRFLR